MYRFKKNSDLYNRNSKTRLWDGRTIQPALLEIGLREEFHDLLFGTVDQPQRGHWVAYRRFDTSKQSQGYDDVYRVGAEVGPGHTRPPVYPYVDQLVMTRQDSMFNPEMAEAYAPMGLLKGGQYIFYMEYDFKPDQNDQIFDIDWDDMTKRPPDSILNGKYLKKYNIKDTFAYRSDGGRVEYWIVYTNYDLVNA